MPFNFRTIRSVEFGVCIDTEDGESYRLVPCEANVQNALREMLTSTMTHLAEEGGRLEEFSPAEKYGSHERLRLALSSDLVAKHREIYASENLSTDTHGLEDPGNLVSYFCIFRDDQGAKLMAFRRAAQFKGVVKKHLVKFLNDSLTMVEDRLFKLDTDFDFVIFDNQVLIWNPSGFIFTAAMEDQLAASASQNVTRIAQDITCVDFSGLSQFVSKHKLAMRLVAALKSRDDLADISVKHLKDLCKVNKVEFGMKKGKLVPNDGSEMRFLMLLDRRLYTVTLIDKRPETYQAPSRKLAE